MSTSNELSVDPASPTGGDPNSYALVTLEQDKNAYIWAAIRQAECPKVKIVKELKSQNRVDPEKYWTKVESRSRPGVYYFFNRYTGECKWPAANYFSPAMPSAEPDPNAVRGADNRHWEPCS